MTPKHTFDDQRQVAFPLTTRSRKRKSEARHEGKKVNLVEIYYRKWLTKRNHTFSTNCNK